MDLKGQNANFPGCFETGEVVLHPKVDDNQSKGNLIDIFNKMLRENLALENSHGH